MAKMKDGIFGKLSGKIGKYIYVDGQTGPYIRSYPKKNNPQTPAQQNARQNFHSVDRTLKVFMPFVMQGFKTAKANTISGKAKSVNLTSALSGEYPHKYLDYRLMTVAQGLLMPAKNAASSFDANGNLVISWSDNSGEGNARATDRAMLLVYNPELRHSEYILKGATRDTGQDTLAIPPALQDKELHAYIAFISKNETLVSNSVYVEVD